MLVADRTITPPVGNTAVFLQKVCLHHRYIRSRDTSRIVERPERLRAVNVGLAAAVARLETSFQESAGENGAANAPSAGNATDELAAALGQLTIAPATPPGHSRIPVQFVHSSAAVKLLQNPAVKYIHGDIEGDVYLENLVSWVKDSQDKIAKSGSEIPPGLSQGDLYLCPTSIDAIQGALGTVCEAVDTVIAATKPSDSHENQVVNATRAFVAVRPPGHHCGEDTPSGFCFVNNVGVAAAHAHLQHNVNRVVVLDIDLHHGNGTQSIAWQINEETYRKDLEMAHGAPPGKPGLQMYYGSVHDILSYPCEDGKMELVQAASVSIHGSHGQHIENVHLRPYSSEKEFWDELYCGPYARLLQNAEAFLNKTGGPGDDVLIFISCGFDASEHEYPSMSRHHRRVPTSFYRRFAQDTCKLADRFARGRLVSVLEGGYSDRALTSGAMAHLVGLVDCKDGQVDESWWNLNNLTELEKVTKKRRGRISQPIASEPWLARALEIFASIDSSSLIPPTATYRGVVPPSSRVLRERKNPPTTSTGQGLETSSSKNGDATMPTSAPRRIKTEAAESSIESSTGSRAESYPPSTDSDSDSLSALSDIPEEGTEPKKLPRVILRLGPRPSA